MGTTPRRAHIWQSSNPDWTTFVSTALEVLTLLEETAAADNASTPPFEVLATETHELDNVNSAYDLAVLARDEASSLIPQASDALLDAADVLTRVAYRIEPVPDSPNFLLHLSRDGLEIGTLNGSLSRLRDKVMLRWAQVPAAAPSDELAEIAQALSFMELTTVYYDTGHTFQGDGLWLQQSRPMSFPRWRWHNFSG